jgi:membrane associated rhomboid family serine protease
MSTSADPSAPGTCYRHPDRQTRLACSNCGRYICTECSRDAAVGQKCPDCSAPEGRHRVITAAAVRRQVNRSAPVSFVLIGINVLVFGIGQFDLAQRVTFFVNGSLYHDAVAAGEWWRAFTSMFLHANFTHILLNMWALLLFGPVLERRYGSLSFTSLYLASGLGGSAVYYLLGRSEPAVGASGAIFGLFGALIVATYRQRHTPAGRAIFSQLVILLLINLSLPLIIQGVAWEAHVGGLVAGMAITAAWDRLPVQGRQAAIRRTMVALAVAAISLVAVIL